MVQKQSPIVATRWAKQLFTPPIATAAEKPDGKASDDSTGAIPNSIWEIQSLDNLVKIDLAPHKQTFQVTFPTRVFSSESDLLYYTWITQTHPTMDPPKYWVYPLLLLLKRNQSLDPTDLGYEDLIERLDHLVQIWQLFEPKLEKRSRDIYNALESTDLDVMPELIINNSYITTKLPPFDKEALHPSHSSNTSFRGHSDIRSLCKTDAIAVMQTKLGVFRTLILSPENIEIQIQLNEGTILQTTSDFKFLRIWPSQGWIEEMYLVEGIMNKWTNQYTGTVHNLSEIISLALGLYQNAHSFVATQSTTTADDTLGIAAFSNHTLKNVIVPQVGEFTYYSDGRAKCRFLDRTIIEVPRDYMKPDSVAAVLDNFGISSHIRVSNPVGYHEQIGAMLEFIRWAKNEPRRSKKQEIDKDVLEKLIAQRERSLQFEHRLKELL